MADRIQLRRDTAANWTSTNPILAQGELGVETDTNKFKVGNGTSAWSALGYLIDTGSYVTGQSSSVDSEIALFSGTGGKTVKRATTTGILKAASGVLSAATAGTDYVTPTGSETLTNKTLTSPIINTGTASSLTLNDGYTEEVYNLTGTELNPANGSIQTKTLSANTTFTDALASGQSLILGIDDGSAYTVTWPTITWTTTPATAPTLPTTGYLWVVLWKVGATLYGKY